MPKHKPKNVLLWGPQFSSGFRFAQLFPETLRYLHKQGILKKLLSLSKKYEFRTIYKNYPPGDENYDPMPEVIRNLDDYSIIWKSGRGFNKLLSRSKMFLTDCISTTIYDAADMGVPSLCLRYHKAAPVRKDVLTQFGKSIFIYKDILDALAYLEFFISTVINVDK